MALTRQERQALEEIIKRVRKLERENESLNRRVQSLEEMIVRLDSQTDMSAWTEEQWDKFLRPFMGKAIINQAIKKHDHTTDGTGGPAFAKLGANLISQAEADLLSGGAFIEPDEL